MVSIVLAYPICGCSRQFVNVLPCSIKSTLLLVHAASNGKVKLYMQIRTSNKWGFTLVEIMIVVAIIGLLAAIAIPNFVKARTTSQANACINNLRQIDGAKQQWALETKQTTTATPNNTSLQPYVGRGSQGGIFPPLCPGAGTYTIGTVAEAPSCSLSGQNPNPHLLQ